MKKLLFLTLFFGTLLAQTPLEYDHAQSLISIERKKVEGAVSKKINKAKSSVQTGGEKGVYECQLNPSGSYTQMLANMQIEIASLDELNASKNQIAYENCCAQKDSAACFLNGVISAANDSAKRNELIAQSCDLGFSIACYAMGILAADLGDISSAASFYQRGCDIGSSGSCHNLAVLYSNGLGVAKDQDKALELYEKACNDGFVNSCNNLAVLYLQIDYNKAAFYFEKACNDGKTAACQNLASLYVNGIGVEKDLEKARFFYNKVINQGSAMSFLFSQEGHLLLKK